MFSSISATTTDDEDAPRLAEKPGVFVGHTVGLGRTDGIPEAAQRTRFVRRTQVTTAEQLKLTAWVSNYVE